MPSTSLPMSGSHVSGHGVDACLSCVTTEIQPQEVQMLALVVFERGFGAYVCHRSPAGLHRHQWLLLDVLFSLLPSPDRHNNSEHTRCSCQSVSHSSGEHFSSCRLHVCNFLTGLLACVVDIRFIVFSQRPLRTFWFIS